MSTHYEIRQQVKSVSGKRLEKVFESNFERIACQTFQKFKQDFTNEYFELILINHSEECLDFTPILERITSKD